MATKYSIARDCLLQVKEAATSSGLDASECLEALLVLGVLEHAETAGGAATQSLLAYELAQIEGRLDLDFIRSR